MIPNPCNYVLSAMRLCYNTEKNAYITCGFIFASNKLWFQFSFLKILILIFAVKGGANLTVSTMCEFILSNSIETSCLLPQLQ